MKCGRCQDVCHGNVVTVQDKYFHQYCFSCIKCSRDLLTDGYFVKDGEVYCTNDYYELINTEKCSSCHKYVEGEVISVQGSVFHPECFGCQQCGKLFPEGASIIFDGDGYICDECDQANQRRNHPQDEVPESRYNGHQYKGGSYSPRKADSHYINYREYPREEESPQQQEPVLDERSKVAPPPYQMQFESKHNVEQNPAVNRSTSDSHNNCAGCGNDIRSGQALLALDKQWHLWCFTCHKCGCLLAGEYMGRDGLPYCEDDYQVGNKCDLEDGREVSYLDGKKIAASFSCPFFETSAKNDVGVDEVFINLARQMKEARADSVRKAFIRERRRFSLRSMSLRERKCKEKLQALRPNETASSVPRRKRGSMLRGFICGAGNLGTTDI